MLMIATATVALSFRAKVFSGEHSGWVGNKAPNLKTLNPKP